MLDILLPEPGLERPSVVARVRQGVAAAMSQHVRMDRKRHLGPNTDAAEQRMEGLGRHRPVPLGHKDVRGRPLFASRLAAPSPPPRNEREHLIAYQVPNPVSPLILLHLYWSALARGNARGNGSTGIAPSPNSSS